MRCRRIFRSGSSKLRLQLAATKHQAFAVGLLIPFRHAVMLRSVKVAVSRELFKLSNIESRLSQFKGRGGIHCDIVEIYDTDDADQMKNDIKGCEVAFILPSYFPKIGDCLPPSLKWIQSAWAGVQQLNSLHPDARDRLQQCTITRSADAYGPMMAEYTLCAIISMERSMAKIIRGNMEKKWLWADVRE